jgi:hypothetical protein
MGAGLLIVDFGLLIEKHMLASAGRFGLYRIARRFDGILRSLSPAHAAATKHIHRVLFGLVA